MGNEIEFVVDGFPPIKNEALSLMSPTHGQAGPVSALRSAARQATGEHFDPWTGPIAIEVTIYGDPPGDATNYLGGIGDVLQTRRSNLEPTEFGLFLDDKQIRDINFRIEPSKGARYRVHIRQLGPVMP